MKMLKIAASALLLATGLSASADDVVQGTGLFLEPGVTYQVTNSNLDFPGGTSNSQAATRGFGVLLRGGIHLYERFFVAADGRYAMLNYEDNANNFSTTATSWDIAPVVGFQMADYGVRLFGGYVLGGNLDPHSSRGVDYMFDGADGWRVGAGLKLQQFSVNIEWQRLHYANTKLQNGFNGQTGGIKYNGEGVVASVSFPIEFN